MSHIYYKINLMLSYLLLLINFGLFPVQATNLCKKGDTNIWGLK